LPVATTHALAHQVAQTVCGRGARVPDAGSHDLSDRSKLTVSRVSARSLHVFIISRIRETFQCGAGMDEAMKLLGARNWYLPRWLEWLRLERYEPAAAPEAMPAPALV
jgi:hypothetical protein